MSIKFHRTLYDTPLGVFSNVNLWRFLTLVSGVGHGF